MTKSGNIWEKVVIYHKKWYYMTKSGNIRQKVVIYDKKS